MCIRARQRFRGSLVLTRMKVRKKSRRSWGIYTLGIKATVDSFGSTGRDMELSLGSERRDAVERDIRFHGTRV